MGKCNLQEKRLEKTKAFALKISSDPSVGCSLFGTALGCMQMHCTQFLEKQRLMSVVKKKQDTVNFNFWKRYTILLGLCLVKMTADRDWTRKCFDQMFNLEEGIHF